MAYHRLRDKKHSLQVDVQHGVKIFFRHVPRSPLVSPDLRVDQDVDFSESRDGLFNASLSVRNFSDIGLKRGSSPLRSR